jgi:hypothetical protein
MKKRNFVSVFSLTLAALFLSCAVFAAPKPDDDDDAARITTINGLQTITQVGSTATILDAQGNTITVDPNPYKVAIAPSDLAHNLREGDVLVSNIGNTDHGITIVRFTRKQAQGQVFNVNTPNDGVLGPSGLAFDRGKLLVANSTASNVLVFNPNGTVLTTITNPLFNGPWSVTTRNKDSEDEFRELFSFFERGEHHTLATFFTANKFDAKILRVDVVANPQGLPTFNVVEVGQFTPNGTLTKIDLHWLPRLKVGTQILEDVLLAIDPANNRIAAFAKSSTSQGMGTGVTVFQGTPLNMPGGLAINPFNGDLLVVNLMDNNLVELNAAKTTVVGVKQIDPAVVDNQGNGSALFGVVATKDREGNLRVFYTDDNSNTLNSLSAQ